MNKITSQLYPKQSRIIIEHIYFSCLFYISASILFYIEYTKYSYFIIE